MKYFNKVNRNLIMGEDILYSTILYTQAKKMILCDHDCYFYYRHNNASTSLTLPRDKIMKNVDDIFYVFRVGEDYLISINIADVT